MDELDVFLEADTIESQNALVRACRRYIKNRPHQLDYKAALAQSLPIGSGEIESAHRYIIQQRLKLQGAWQGSRQRGFDVSVKDYSSQ